MARRRSIEPRHEGTRDESRWLIALGLIVGIFVTSALSVDAYTMAFVTLDEPQSIPTPLRGQWTADHSPPLQEQAALPSITLSEGMITFEDKTYVRAIRYTDSRGRRERETWLAITERDTSGWALSICGHSPIGFIRLRLSGADHLPTSALRVDFFTGRLDRLLSSRPPEACAEGRYSR